MSCTHQRLDFSGAHLLRGTRRDLRHLSPRRACAARSHEAHCMRIIEAGLQGCKALLAAGREGKLKLGRLVCVRRVKGTGNGGSSSTEAHMHTNTHTQTHTQTQTHRHTSRSSPVHRARHRLGSVEWWAQLMNEALVPGLRLVQSESRVVGVMRWYSPPRACALLSMRAHCRAMRLGAFVGSHPSRPSHAR